MAGEEYAEKAEEEEENEEEAEEGGPWLQDEEGYEEEEEESEDEEEEAGPPSEMSRLRHAGPPHRNDGEGRPWLLPPSRWWGERTVAGPDHSRELDAANGGPRQRPRTPSPEWPWATPQDGPPSARYQHGPPLARVFGELSGPAQDLNAPLNSAENALIDSGRGGASGRVFVVRGAVPRAAG